MKVIPINGYNSLYDHPKPPAPPHTSKPNIDALSIAQNEFGTAFDRREMKLRGRPIKLPDLMREVNRKRLADGRPQCLYNPAWDVRNS